MIDREMVTILDNLVLEIAIPSRLSNYTCCVFIENTQPGSGPPPHKHLKEEEIFTVLEGSYEFYKEGTWSAMETGRPVLSLRDTFHAFRNVGDTTGRMMLVTNGGGIDDYFRAIAGLKLPDDLERLTEISTHYGYIYQPPPEA